MKKSLLVSLILLSGILLTACGKKTEENVNTNTQEAVNPVESSEINDDLLISNDVEVDCEKVIQKYLDGADKEGKGEGVKVGDNIVVDYIGRLEDGTVFDTSIESVAKACGKYNDGRDYTQGLSFEAGAGQMIKGFDDGVVGMKLGQTKTVKFGPDEGYGQRNEQYIRIHTKEEVGGDLSQYEIGGGYCMDWYICGIIIKVTDKELVVDYNHELAGKDLIFDITIKSIN